MLKLEYILENEMLKIPRDFEKWIRITRSVLEGQI